MVHHFTFRIPFLSVCRFGSLLIGLCMGLFAAAAEPLVGVEVRTKRETDTVELTVKETQTTLEITSPTGISHAVITRTGDTWPEQLVLKLRLSGLEQFEVTSGPLTLQASVSSHPDAHRFRQWQNTDEAKPLETTSPHWIPIRLLDKEGQPTDTIPLKGGHFELSLPATLFVDTPGRSPFPGSTSTANDCYGIRSCPPNIR